MANGDSDAFPAGLRPHFRAFAEGVLPPARGYDEEEWARAEALVAAALGERPPSVRRQIRIFLRAVNLLPLFTRGRTLRGLGPDEREAFLSGLQDSRLLPIRRGVWGLRTLAFMGHYARPEVHGGIGYGARLRGRREHPDGDRLAGGRRDAPGREEG